MNDNPLFTLAALTAASSIAILLVGLLRMPLRHSAGARAAYWLWLLVPATALAMLLPVPSHSVDIASSFQGGAATLSVLKVMVIHASSGYAAPALACGLLAGVFMMLSILVHRQRAFVRSLGGMICGPDNIHRSSAAAPMVVGAWPARVVIPEDFETRYGPEERALMLAHERAHLSRGDAQLNVIVAGWQCLFWFNPIVHWAARQFRFDQELACDALVVARTETARRRYADVLLKTQIANDATSRVPLGCYWQSNHPLKARIAMLKGPSPTLPCRLMGIGFCVTASLLSSYTVWALQPEWSSISGPNTTIAIKMKWSINEVDALNPMNADPSGSPSFIVDSGKEFVRKASLTPGDFYETRCVASLPDGPKPSPKWELIKAAGQTTAGLILLECRLSNNKEVFSSPSIAVRGGKAGSIEVANKDGSVISRLELTASTSTIVPTSP